MNILKNVVKALPPIKKVLQQRDDYRNQAEQLCNNLNKFKLKNEEMRMEVERLNERLHFTKKELEESAIKNNELTAQLQEIVAENRSLTIYNTEAEQKLTQLNVHNAALAEDNAVLRQRNEVLQKQLSKSEVFFSSYGEDVILRRIFYNPNRYHSKHHIERGFYVDVGAHHPDIASNTKFFYDQGWSGINIEANPGVLKAFESFRTRDININCAVMPFDGSTTFYLFGEEDSESYGSSSTTDEKYSQYVSESQNVESRILKVPAARLETIFEQHKVKRIDFMSMDIEKAEYEALQSNNWDKYRPLVLAIEILPENGDYVWTYRNNPIFSYLADNGYVVFSCSLFTWFFYDKHSERIEFIDRWTKLEY